MNLLVKANIQGVDRPGKPGKVREFIFDLKKSWKSGNFMKIGRKTGIRCAINITFSYFSFPGFFFFGKIRKKFPLASLAEFCYSLIENDFFMK